MGSRSDLLRIVEGLKAVDVETKILGERKTALMKDLANSHSPVHIGEIVEITGYSYRGKSFRVESLYGSRRWGCLAVIAVGPLRLKDGSFSDHTTVDQRYEITPKEVAS